MGKSAASRSEPPGNRTLPNGSTDSSKSAPGAPDSVALARTLMVALQRHAASEEKSPSEAARIERAWAAWSLGGHDDETVQHVAHLVDRAYSALRTGTPRKPSKKSSGLAASSCAQVLYNGLPPAVASQLDFSDVLTVVHELERGLDRWPTVVKATAELLGWNKTALAHAGNAVKQALDTKIDRP